MRHVENPGCNCAVCCAERQAVHELRRRRSIEILGPRWAPLQYAKRLDHPLEHAEYRQRVETIQRAIAGYANG